MADKIIDNTRKTINSYDDFSKAFIKENDFAYLNNADIKADISLRDCNYYTMAKETIIFQNCTFFNPLKISKLNTKHLDFDSCTFHKSLEIDKIDIESINLEQCMFDREVSIDHCNLVYLRLFTSTFRDLLTVKESSIDNFILHGLKEYTTFNGDVQIAFTIFNYANFSNTHFEKELYIQDVIFRGNAMFTKTKVKGKLTLISSFSTDRTINDNISEFIQFQINGKGFFEEMEVHEMEIQYVAFEYSLYLNNSKIDLLKIHNIHIQKDFHFRGLKVHCKDQETACFLKNQALIQNDKILALEMRAQEMELYKKSLENKKWPCDLLTNTDWWILKLNSISNSNGTSWWKGVKFTLAIWIVFFTLYIIARDGWGDTFIFTNDDYLKEFVRFFWLPNSMDDINNAEQKITFSTIIFYLLGKIFITYGIYQTISAFRKHNK